MRSILAAGLILIAGPALSEEIPRIDVDAVCKDYVAGKPRHAHGTPEEQVAECFSSRQEEYDQLKTVWSKLDRAAQNDCWAGAKLPLVFVYYQARLCAERVLDLQERTRRAAEERARIQGLPKQEMRW